MVSLRSQIAQKVLGYFLLHENAQLYVNELARRLEVDGGNLSRKLSELEGEGLLKSRVRGNERFYAVNPSYPLLQEYKKIILKTVGLEHLLRQALLRVRGIQAAYLFGSYAQNRMDASSDIDLLVVGAHSTIDLQRSIATVRKSVDREINLVSMSPEEYRGNKRKHPLLRSIRETERIRLR